MSYVNVAIGLPTGPFTYHVDESDGDRIKRGIRVRVPFRNTTKIGYVVDIVSETSHARIKSIENILDDDPVVSTPLLQLTQWMSQYYMCSWGEALDNALPRLVRQGRALGKDKDGGSIHSSIIEFKHILTEDQQTVFDVIAKDIADHQHSKYVLQGVTGSGKSEIYLRLINETLRSGRTVICMVPEIALTIHLTNYFKEYFGDTLEGLHSKMTDAERFHAWCRIKAGSKRVVLGARSALFSPLENIGLIIMDEEHENSYKQSDAPRYHAREVAERCAAIVKAVFVMGSATPSLEARYGCETGRFTHLRLSKRIVSRSMPEVQVIDLRNEMTRGGNLLVSHPLRSAMEKTLGKKESVLLFLNRRGYSTCIVCMDCGDVLMCPSCKVSLTYHESFKKALCHYCNYRTDVPQQCGACASKNLKFGGSGTERIESHVKKLFPRAIVERLDTDRVRKRGEAEAIITRFAQGKIDVLIGTQMLAKGFDFPHVTLVGVINADVILSIPDFRSFERGFQLLTQVAGRTGRGVKGGRVIVQTFMPDNYAVQLARKHDYENFYSVEKATRMQLSYPPTSTIINIIIRSRDEKKIESLCLKLKQKLEEIHQGVSAPVEIMGPAPLPFYKLRNYYRWHVMFKGTDGEYMRTLVRDIVTSISRSKDTYVAVDVDPISIL